MREISPAENMPVDEFLSLAPIEVQERVAQIRSQKKAGARPRPSTKLIDRSRILNSTQRASLLDVVAGLVDENLCGRSEMCMQFASLLQRALAYLGFACRPVIGRAIYYANGREIFCWEHAWVRAGDEVVDGNVDSLCENPMVPRTVDVSPYWGPIVQTPTDRKLLQDRGRVLAHDRDVAEVWWPELRAWLDEHFGR